MRRGSAGTHRLCERCLQSCQEVMQQVGNRFALRTWDRDDFTQDVWLAVLQLVQRGGFESRRGRFRDWLFVVARNRAVTLFRRRWRQQREGTDVLLDYLPEPEPSDPRAALARQCEIERVRAAVALLAQRLSPMNYAVFQARNMRECSVREVAEELGLTATQVRVYDHRARQRLASLLTHQPPHLL